MKVNISELKAKLSAYLNAVRRGETVTVLDRRTAIARVVPLSERAPGLQIETATRTPSSIGRVRRVRPLSPIDIDAVLDESRGER